MALNPSIQKATIGGGEQLITYNFQDVVAQTGYLSFYPFSPASGAYAVTADDSVLSPFIETHGIATSSGAWATAMSLTIDLPFNLSKNIKGDAFFTIPFALANSAPRASGAIFVSLYKNSGATNTFIASGASAIYMTENVTTNYISGAMVVKINIPSITHFAVNDNLRVIEDFRILTTGGFPTTPVIGHNPAGIDYGVYPAQATIQLGKCFNKQKWLIPFKLDL